MMYFICYKETDDSGERTQDSVLAQEIFNELEKEGIKVFFSRISLEDHIGENYEPYIYRALSTAKVMIVVTITGDNLNSVWVKNEWKRFIRFMEDDSSKSIIPVIKDISPYDLPSELTKFQAQDMGKIGALQDLVRGIKKLIDSKKHEFDNDSIRELLIDRKKKKAIKELWKARSLPVIQCLILLVSSIYVYFPSHVIFENSHIKFTSALIIERFPFLSMLYWIVYVLALFTGIVGILSGYKCGVDDKKFFAFTVISQLLQYFALLCVSALYFRPVYALISVVSNSLVVLMSSVVLIRYRYVKRALVFFLVVVCTLLLSLPFATRKLRNEGVITDSLKDQVVVCRGYADLMYKPSERSIKIAEVYSRQVFNVISKVKDVDSYWYEIETSSGVRGFIEEEKVEFKSAH